jgi:hypothetical protein
MSQFLTADRMNGIAPRIHVYISYFCLLYFLEIIYIMVLLFLVGGRFPSLAAGAALSLLLSYHIVMLYYKNSTHRKIQLYLMDLHLAISAAAFMRLILWDSRSTTLLLSFMFIRLIIMILEPFFIYFLTDRTVIEQFS